MGDLYPDVVAVVQILGVLGFPVRQFPGFQIIALTAPQSAIGNVVKVASAMEHLIARSAKGIGELAA
jgi:hypothetical protein